MVSSSSIFSLAIFFGPILLPKALVLYRSLRVPSNVTPCQLPRATSRALTLLFCCALIFLLSTFPIFNPTNIFQTTQSRLQAPTGVLFTRLGALRPLTPTDEALRGLFDASGLQARLLYTRFGPDVLSTCPLTEPKNAYADTIYLLYALPTIMAPHLAHLLVLGLVTSHSIAGRSASQWRTTASIAGISLAVADILATATNDHRLNATATRLSQVDFFYWKARLFRGLLLAAFDSLLGWTIYLSATNRAFVEPLSAADRIDRTTRTVESVLGKLRGLGAVKNVVFRDTAMRSRVERYWIHEEQLSRAIYEEREVVSAFNESLQAFDVAVISREADVFVDSVLGPETVNVAT